MVSNLHTNVEYLNDLYEFSLTDLTWKTLEPKNKSPSGFSEMILKPQGRRYHCSAIVGNEMFIFGGENAKDEMLNDLYKLDLQTLKWTNFHSFGQVPEPRRYSTLVAKGKTLILFGGRDEQVRMNDMWMFNCLSENWTPIQTYGEIPSLRSAHTCEILGDSMFIFGGMDGNKINQIHEFDTLTCRWKLLEISGKFKPEARYWHASVITEEGVMYIHGGGDHDSVRSDMFKIKLRSKVMNLQSGLLDSLNFGKLNDALFLFNE
jgi:hypothetical protein